jgi:hypothetical protein
MTDTGCNGVSLDAMGASAGWVIAGGEVPEWTRGVSYPVGFQRRIVVGGEVNGLAKVTIGPQET